MLERRFDRRMKHDFDGSSAPNIRELILNDCMVAILFIRTTQFSSFALLHSQFLDQQFFISIDRR